MAEKHSFKSLRRSGKAKSRDLYRFRHSDLVIIPGQSGRDTTTQRYRDSLDEIVAFMRKGGKVPPLEVNVNPDTGAVEIVQGHRRHYGYGVTIPEKQAELRGLLRDDMDEASRQKLLEKIDDLEYVDCVPSEGNDLARCIRITTGNTSLAMSDVEVANNYGRLESEFGLEPTQIAEAIGKPLKHVKMHLALHHANHDVQQAVEEGRIALTEAVELLAKHGSKTGEVIAAEHAKAVKNGKTKVTKGTMRGIAIPRRLLDAGAAAVTAVRSSLSDDAIQAITSYRETGSDCIIGLQASVLHGLVDVSNLIAEAREKAEERQAKNTPPEDDHGL